MFWYVLAVLCCVTCEEWSGEVGVVVWESEVRCSSAVLYWCLLVVDISDG